jgi:hypothetical protein
MTDRPNIPVPDELADVRAEMKRLELREAELRATLLADPSARTGKDYLAEIKTVTSQRTDLRELRAMHPGIVDEYTFPTEVTRVVLWTIDEDGVLSHQKRAAKPGDTQ